MECKYCGGTRIQRVEPGSSLCHPCPDCEDVNEIEKNNDEIAKEAYWEAKIKERKLLDES